MTFSARTHKIERKEKIQIEDLGEVHTKIHFPKMYVTFLGDCWLSYGFEKHSCAMCLCTYFDWQNLQVLYREMRMCFAALLQSANL
jgi:hypothetical protein